MSSSFGTMLGSLKTSNGPNPRDAVGLGTRPFAPHAPIWATPLRPIDPRANVVTKTCRRSAYATPRWNNPILVCSCFMPKSFPTGIPECCLLPNGISIPVWILLLLLTNAHEKNSDMASTALSSKTIRKQDNTGERKKEKEGRQKRPCNSVAQRVLEAYSRHSEANTVSNSSSLILHFVVIVACHDWICSCLEWFSFSTPEQEVAAVDAQLRASTQTYIYTFISTFSHIVWCHCKCTRLSYSYLFSRSSSARSWRMSIISCHLPVAVRIRTVFGLNSGVLSWNNDDDDHHQPTRGEKTSISSN